jgi:hypothetical protein
MKKLPFGFLSVFVLAVLIFGACEQPAGSNPAWEAAEVYKRAHAAVLGKETATITEDDEGAVNAALGAYQALGADSQALLGGEKALLDSLKARIETLEENRKAAGAFTTDHAAILSRETAALTAEDGGAVNAALDAYRALGAEAQAQLAGEKALLDSFKATIDALVATQAAAAFATDHAAILSRETAALTSADEGAVNAALDAYRALGAEAQALLTGEKALLDSLKAGIDALIATEAAAAAYKRAHAAALSKETAAVTSADEGAVNAALDAYRALGAEAQALLGGEKALLDSLKARIDALIATEAPAAAYKGAHAAALSKTEASVMTGDEGAVDGALGAYQALEGDVQALLTGEKALLDKLKTKIELLKGDGPAQRAANAFKENHAAVLFKTEASVVTGDEGAVGAALGAYQALEGDAQALLAAEKALLDSLKARIGALFEAQAAAAAFKADHAAVLSKPTDRLALGDQGAVDRALAAYAALNGDARSLLAAEKALLDSHKLRIDVLEAEAFKTAQAAILGKTTDWLTVADKAALDGALGAYAALDGDVQALLTGEKALLDSLKAKIGALEKAEAFKTAQAAILSKPTDWLALADKGAVNTALGAYAALGGDVQALLAVEKALLDSHKIRINALEAGAFKTAQAAILGKATAGLTVADKGAVDGALGAYAALGGDVQALLAVEKALLDSHKIRIDALEEAGAFTTTQAAILGKTVGTVAIADEGALNGALTAYAALGAEAQALLTVEKALLDSLKAGIATRKAQAFTTAHAAILGKTAVTVAIADEGALNGALTAYRSLGTEIQALLTVEKTLLDSLKAGIDTRKAEAFTTAHAAILGKTAGTVAAADEGAVDAALAAYNALEGSVKALLAEKQRLLDSLKERIEELKGVEQGEFIFLFSEADLELIGTAYPLEGNYRLAADLELGDWTPIGSAGEPFSGIFEGDNYRITIKSFDEALFDDGMEQEPGIGLGIFGWTRGSPETPVRVRNLRVRAELNQLVRETDACYVGALVGYADEYTELSNITVEGSLDFTNKNTGDPQRPVYVGGVAGALIASELKDSDVSADIRACGLAGNGLYNYVGGMAGMFDRNQVEWGLNPVPVPGAPFAGSSITNCRVTGHVYGWTEGSATNIFAGGIAGGSFHGMKTYYSGKIEDCSSTGNVTASGGGYWSEAGGIAGFICGDGHDNSESPSAGASATGPTRIVRCYATGVIAAEGPSGSWPYVGGIVGNNYYGSLVSQCWFNGTVKAEGEGINDYTGGIAGYNSKQYGHSSRIEDCWSAGRVEGYLNAGGIVGQNQVAAIVSRCYSRSEVSVRAAKSAAASQSQAGAGGIAGYNSVADARAGGTVENCVALNPSISSGGGFDLLHRVVGNGDGSHSNNRARQDMEISINGSPVTPGDKGAHVRDGADCAAQPAQSVYQGLGWNFSGVWTMSGDYPVLSHRGP